MSTSAIQSLPFTNTSTPATDTTTSYHLQYEKKQKNVSRLLATLIVPTTPAMDRIASVTLKSDGSNTTATVKIASTLQPVIPLTLPSTSTTTKGPAIIYPTVAPESVVIPIVSSIIGFPILALLVICCLRKRAKLARERDRRRNYDMQDHTANLVRMGHRINGRNSRTLSVCSERSISWAYPSMDLDTVYEERSDPEPYRDKY